MTTTNNVLFATICSKSMFLENVFSRPPYLIERREKPVAQHQIGSIAYDLRIIMMGQATGGIRRRRQQNDDA
jgi:hypothetical protein